MQNVTIATTFKDVSNRLNGIWNGMLRTLASCWNKERLDVFETKIEKAGSYQELNLGHLACAASALLLSYDNRTTTSPHNPLCILYAKVVLNCLSLTPGSHSVCAIRTLLGVDWKIPSIKREPILSGFLSLMLEAVVFYRIFC